VAVTGRNSDKDDDEQGAPSETPWYNRTPEVIGASVLGVLVIGILVFAVSYVARQFNEAPQAPLYYVEPSFAATATSTSSPTTTQTVTSTSPPMTTDINGPSSTTPSSTETTSGERIPPRTRESDVEDDGETRTTRRPRTNVTRTLYPQP
jgi:hypothetical protein